MQQPRRPPACGSPEPAAEPASEDKHQAGGADPADEHERRTSGDTEEPSERQHDEAGGKQQDSVQPAWFVRGTGAASQLSVSLTTSVESPNIVVLCPPPCSFRIGTNLIIGRSPTTL